MEVGIVCCAILGNKIGMTHIFDKNGSSIPITVLRVGPCFITQIKTIDTDGYNAIQIGYLALKPNSKKQNKAIIGHFKHANIAPLRYLKEYRVKETNDYKLGQLIQADVFEKGSFVDITGQTIGKGFAGNQKRHNFKRGLMTHGSKNHRAPGSIGASTYPGRVFPGKKMAGHLGAANRTIKNLEVIEVNITENLLVIKGSIPGKTGSLITVKPSKAVKKINK